MRVYQIIMEGDIINEILSTGIHNYSFQRKYELKNKRPTPNLNLNTIDGKTVRKFRLTWYSKYAWLAGSKVRNKLFCYYCLLLQGEKTWSDDGVSAIKNFERKACKHAISQKHLACQEKFKLLGENRIEHALSEGRRLAAIKHNEQVGVNRRILSRLINVVCYLGKQELVFRSDHESSSSLNKGNYLELLDLLAQEEQVLKDHFMSNSVFKGTSSDVQNDLVTCVTDVLNTKIMNELQSASFVSIQADETTDVSCKSQISIILRYVVDNTIEERFVGFFDVSKDKSASGLSNVMLSEIKKWNIGDKIVCQTYDGATVMAGQRRGIQAIIKETYPGAMFIHCYAHQLNLVLLHGSKTIKSVRIFISDLTMFHTFFRRSPKRSELLRERGFKLPQSCETRWNYHSRAAATISTHFIELQKAIACVIEEGDWDPTSVSMACGLMHKLSNPEFVYLLCLFHKIFIYVDHVSLILQTKSTAAVQTCVNEVKILSNQLSAMRNEETVSLCCKSAAELNNELKYLEKDICSLRDLTYEILDSLIVQIDVRFQDYKLLKFAELTDSKAFKEYRTNFPNKKLEQLAENFPGIFDSERLKNELKIIFSDPDKFLSPKELLNYIFQGQLQDVYQEVTKLLQLVLCIPVTTASSGRNMSALKRIKTFLRNTMNHDRLTNLCSLAIEKKFLGELVTDPTFTNSVINLFAKRKNRRIELTYKVPFDQLIDPEEISFQPLSTKEEREADVVPSPSFSGETRRSQQYYDSALNDVPPMGEVQVKSERIYYDPFFCLPSPSIKKEPQESEEDQFPEVIRCMSGHQEMLKKEEEEDDDGAGAVPSPPSSDEFRHIIKEELMDVKNEPAETEDDDPLSLIIKIE